MVTKSKQNECRYYEKVRHVSSRIFRNKERECLKDKIYDLETKSKNENFTDFHIGLPTWN
jgi:hypothetical protein